MKGLLLVVLSMVLMLSGCSTIDSQKLQSKIDSLERQIGFVSSRQDALEERIITPVTENVVTYAEERTIPVKKKTWIKTKKSLSSKDIQRSLKNAGYYYGSIDGRIGSKSKKAIREFQEDNGLKVDGIAGPQTQTMLMDYLYVTK